jgi:hypothetical protein
MILKSGYRFSEKIMLQRMEHDPEKWEPVFRKGHAPVKEHDPEKWKPVFRKDQASVKC